MSKLFKLALAAGALCCALSSQAAPVYVSLDEIPNTFKDRMSCLQGITLLKAHNQTISNLSAEGWRNLIIDGAVNNPWEVISNMTWEIMANNVTMYNLGVRPDVLKNGARDLWRMEGRNRARAEKTIESLYDKCYSNFKVTQDGQELAIKNHDELLQGFEEKKIGWDAYPYLERILGYKMDFDGKKLKR